MRFFKKNHKGMILILTFMIIVALTAIVGTFIFLTSTQLKGSGYDVASQNALWLAEAGIQQAIWLLKTPVASGGLGQDGVTAGITANLGNGSYTIVISSWDFALSANGATAADSPAGSNPTNVNDGDDTTFWESSAPPSILAPQIITITFPSAITINNASFVVPAGGIAPSTYTLATSPDNSAWTTVATNSNTTNRFLIKTGVKYLRLRTTAGATADQNIRVASISTKGSKITSTGTVGGISRTIRQTVVVKQSTQTGYGKAEIDWTEI